MGKRIVEEVKRFKEVIKKRGKMWKDSDVDIIVVNKKFGRKDTFRITPKLYAEWHEKQRIDYPVDIILSNTKEFNKLKKEVCIVSETLRE